jgi:hypothetical protein
MQSKHMSVIFLLLFSLKQKLRFEIGLGYDDGVLLRKTSPEETTAWSPRCVSPGAKTERGMQFMIKTMIIIVL